MEGNIILVFGTFFGLLLIAKLGGALDSGSKNLPKMA